MPSATVAPLRPHTRISSSAVRSTRTVPQRECDRRPHLFDLPSPAPAGMHQGAISPTQGDDSWVTFEAMDAEDEASTAFSTAAAKAVKACQDCPFLAQCQDDTYRQIRSGNRPQGEVLAAVAFNDAGVPDPGVHTPVRARERDQLTFDCELGLDGAITDPDIDWLPADLETISIFDSQAVEMALDGERVNFTVTQSHLDANPDEGIDGRIVLSYDDEWEVLRRGLRDGVTRYRMSQILGTRWQRVSEMAHIIGFPIDGAFEPTAWAERRRPIHVADLAQQDLRQHWRRAAQKARDSELLRANKINADVKRRARRAGFEFFRRPPRVPLRLPDAYRRYTPPLPF